jgi:hypothetical protein
VVDDENAEFYLGNLQLFLMKDDDISMEHVYVSQYSEIFQPHCLIDREKLYSNGCDFNGENEGIFQPSFPLNFEEIVHKKTMLKDPFMTVNGMKFARF